ncbi:hypothetical protein [Tsuneonella amylolytica]|uniref:hypothetical protein n=1 Tax=Tsuneonella amylolytica TaxID=2338327 RepID=UPI0013C51404|nr:hypothetical protein [Tsuneonella amylolytica]
MTARFAALWCRAMKRLAVLLAPAILLAACQTSNGDQWNGPRLGTPYRQAEKTCFDQVEFVTGVDAKRDFFIGCMNALGWTPKAGAKIDL